MITSGVRVKILKGCKARELHKGTTWLVTAVEPLGADYSHSVRVSLQRLNGFGPDRVALFARHSNRLADPIVSLNDGRPQNRIQVTITPR